MTFKRDGVTFSFASGHLYAHPSRTVVVQLTPFINPYLTVRQAEELVDMYFNGEVN